MPSATPAKRVLAETTNARANVQPSPRSAKKLKLDRTVVNDGRMPVKQVNGSFNSSQPKSQFEEEVLEKMTQEMENLKRNGTEKDQQWSRPVLEDWDSPTQNLCFQQIEAEEGALNGGRTTVKLFGVTDVSVSVISYRYMLIYAG
jgi:DNA polymerase delta subunit 1